MKKTKLVQLLETLNKQECQQLLNALSITSQKTDKEAIALLKTLLKHHPQYPDHAVEKHKVFIEAFPGRFFNGNYLRKKTSTLFTVLKKLLIETELLEEQHNREIAFLKQLRKRGLSHLYELQEAKIRNALQEKQQKDSQSYLEHYQLAQEADLYFGGQQERRYDSALQEKSNALDIFYLTQKLKIFCEMLNRSKIITSNYAFHLKDEILIYLNNHQSLSELPTVGIYLQIIKTLTEENNESHYFRLVKMLGEYTPLFSTQEASELYQYAQNYCIRKINTGNRQYLRSLFDLYKDQLSAGTIIIKGILKANDYKNIITVGLQLEEVKWVHTFLHEYKIYLPESHSENVFNYNLVVYYFFTKAYDKAIELLRTVHFTDAYYEINGKIILLKIYYHQEAFVSIYYLIDAFKLNLKRSKKVASNYRLSITNFLIQFKKLTLLKEKLPYLNKQEHKKRYQSLKKRLEQVDLIFDRKWLLATLETLSLQ